MDEMKEVLLSLQLQLKSLPDSEKKMCADLLKSAANDLENSTLEPELNQQESADDPDPLSFSGVNNDASVLQGPQGLASRPENCDDGALLIDQSELDLILGRRRSDRTKRKPQRPIKLHIANSDLFEPEPEATFTCSCCGVEFQSWSQLEYHLYGAHERILVTCLKCKGTFANKALLVTHECFSPGQKVFLRRQCGYCEQLFTSRLAFTKHKRKVHKEVSSTDVSCLHCSNVFNTKKQLHKHILETHANGQKLCSDCGHLFATDSALSDHVMQAHSSPGMFPCFPCRLQFKTEEQLHGHMLSRHKYNCPNCNRLFSNYAALQRHCCMIHGLKLPSQNPAKRSRCDFCHMTFSRPSRLDYHIRMKHPNSQTSQESRPTHCTPCDMELPSQDSLERHRRTKYHELSTGKQNLERNHVCHICGKAFFRSNTLKRHLAIHQNDYPFKCDYCDFKTVEKSNLDEHMARHFEFKRFECQYCRKKFVVKRSLDDHISFKHNNEKNFICSICGMRFKTKGVLSRHQKTHGGEKNFICVCGCKFTRLSNLRRHLNKVHDNSAANFIWPTPAVKKVGKDDPQASSTSSSSVAAHVVDLTPSVGQLDHLPLVSLDTLQPPLHFPSQQDDSLPEFSTSDLASATGKSMDQNTIWRPMDNPCISTASSAVVNSNMSQNHPCYSTGDLTGGGVGGGQGGSRLLTLDEVVWSSASYTGSLSCLLGPAPTSQEHVGGQQDLHMCQLSGSGHQGNTSLHHLPSLATTLHQHQQCSDFSVGYLIGNHNNVQHPQSHTINMK